MIRQLKNLTFGAVAIGASTLLLATSSSAKMGAPPSAAVEIANFTFRSQVVTVKPGTVVTWTNDDDIPHTIVSRDGVFKSKVLDTGDHFSLVFAKPGQFGYFCSLHPHMTGTIIVKA